MAKNKPSLLARLGLSSKRWNSEFVEPANQIKENNIFSLHSATTVATLLSNKGKRQARTRQAIYEKWASMEADPIISTALLLLVTSALGGHETSGDMVFIEKSANAKKNPQLAHIAEEISRHLSPLFNRVAFQMAYTGAVFGDAYARIYCNENGVIDLNSDEMIRPPLVQAFERGSRTVGFAVYTGERNFERLDVSQIARLKMPRTQWIPQFGVIEKSLKIALKENDIDQLPLMPALVGGSLLYNAEEAYDNLQASLLGLLGQRWLDSIDEQIIVANMEGMTKEQQNLFNRNIIDIFSYSKKITEDAVKQGKPVLERIKHLLPIWGDKQNISFGPASQNARNGSISIDDIMLHARLLAGALGVDLSMLGFADQLSGGLGEGGFFRVSAQAAERARIIRTSLTDFFNHVIDIHTMHRHGMVFNPLERPWTINFFGSISALETEKQRTKNESMSAGMQLVQAMQMLKDLGANKEIMTEFLSKMMMLDEDQAELFSSILDQQDDKDA